MSAEPVYIGALRRGHYCLTDTSNGNSVAVPLLDVARRMQVQGEDIPPEVFEALPHLGGTEIGGKWWRKFKRKAKRAVKKVARVAKKVAKSRLVKSAWAAAKRMPAPYGTMFQAVDTGYKFGKALVPPKKARKAVRTARKVKSYRRKLRRYKKAKRALPYVRKLAAGRITLSAAKRANRRLKLKRNVIAQAAFALRLKSSPSKTGQAILKRAASINRMGTDARRIKSKSGRSYDVIVKAA